MVGLVRGNVVGLARNLRGAHDRDRTGDLILTKNVLYLLSYVGRRFLTLVFLFYRIGTLAAR